MILAVTIATVIAFLSGTTFTRRIDRKKIVKLIHNNKIELQRIHCESYSDGWKDGAKYEKNEQIIDYMINSAYSN